MRRPARLFIQILLVSVVLNLADWPYLDEIEEATPFGTLTEMLGPKLSDAEKSQGAPHEVRSGYELLLLSLHAITFEPTRLTEPAGDKVAIAPLRLLLSSIPPRIDRPPTLSSRS